MVKVRNSIFSESITKMFTISNNLNHNVRSNDNDYSLQKPKTNFLKKSISYTAAQVWNNLPKSAKHKEISIKKFKAILGRHL